MKNKSLLIAAAIFGALLLALLVLRSGDDKFGVKELKVAKLDKDKVTRIDVIIPAKPDAKAGPADAGTAPTTTQKPNKVTLEKTGDAWKVFDTEEPAKKYPVEEAQLKSLLDASGEFSAGDLIANKKEKLAELELSDDKALAVTVFAGSDKVLDVLFGRPAKGGGTAVRAHGSDDVFVSKGRLGSILKKDLAAWRKKAMVEGVKADEITTVTITRADGGKLVLAQDPKTETVEADAGTPAESKPPVWKLVEPATLPAGFRLDQAALGRVAGAFAALRAQDFADDATEDSAGFKAPHTVVEAQRGDQKIVVHLGQADDKKRVFARVDGDAQIYLLASYTAQQLDRSLDDLRDLSLFTGEVANVEKVALTNGANRVVVARDGSNWKLLDPKTVPAGFDVSQIQAQVAGLLRLRAQKYLGDLGAVPGSGVDGGNPVLEVTWQDGKTQVVRFGKGLPVEATAATPTSTTPPAAKEYYVRGADGAIYAISSFTKTRYEKPAEIFKKPPEPPQGMGGMSGLDKLPPDVRKKLEQQLKNPQRLPEQ